MVNAYYYCKEYNFIQFLFMSKQLHIKYVYFSMLHIPPSSGQSTQDIILKGHYLKTLKNPVQTSVFQITGILQNQI